MLDVDAIRRKLGLLRKADRHFAVFGADFHRYELAPPLPAAEAAAFEQKHSFALPQEYRDFLTELGNGGAGPFYGILPLGILDSGAQLEAVEFIGALSRKFPFTEAWNLPEGRFQPPAFASDEDEERWRDELDREYWGTLDGCLPIAHQGCALRTVLIVSGPLSGTLWDDFRADYRGLRPLCAAEAGGVGFADWYMNWLDSSLEKFR